MVVVSVEDRTLTHMKRLLAIFIVHAAVWVLLVRFGPGDDRVGFDLLGDGSTPWVRQFIVALMSVLVLQVLFMSREKSWKAVFRDRPRSDRKWFWIPGAVILLLGVGRFASDGLSDAPSSYWVGMTITVLLVGFTEEVTFRGILLVEARRRWESEGWALAISSVLFGLFHLPNWYLGQDLGTTIRQVVVTAIIGSGFYALRRASGSLIPCIALHAAYDWMLIQGAF